MYMVTGDNKRVAQHVGQTLDLPQVCVRVRACVACACVCVRERASCVFVQCKVLNVV